MAELSKITAAQATKIRALAVKWGMTRLIESDLSDVMIDESNDQNVTFRPNKTMVIVILPDGSAHS